jgi:ADP-heptose:LPS heptosyltransferase
MQVRTMRFIDYWFGIPMCLFFSVVNSINNFYRKQYRSKVVNRVIFIKLSEMGAISLAYPLLSEVKKLNPDASLYFLTFEKNRIFFSILGEIIPTKNIFTIREESVIYLLTDFFKAIYAIRRLNIDVSFDLEMLTRFSSILTFLTRSKKKIGFSSYKFEGLYRGNFLTHRVQYNPLQHISKSYLSLGKVMSQEFKNTPEFDETLLDEEIILPMYKSRIEIKREIEKKLNNVGIKSSDRIILINPGEWDWPFNLREWPIENYIELVNRLINFQENLKIIIVGSPGISGKSTNLYESVKNKKCVNLTGETSISELLELFLLSEAIIVNDSGLAHFASLTAIKTFVFFGPESPQVFSPVGTNTKILYSNYPCSPCFSVFNHRNSTCKKNNCLRSISVDEVFKNVINSL